METKMITDANIGRNVTPAVFFEQHIRQHAVQYFPDLKAQEVNVRLVNGQQYRHSHFYRFEISGGGKSIHALVKTPPLHSPFKDRPKLGPWIEPSDKFDAQYKAMSKIHEYFTGLADPRFGTVRPLDKLTEHRAIIMEEVPAPSLRQLVEQTSRLKNPLRANGPDYLPLAFHNAGAWLRKFHSIPADQPVKIHNGLRSDFIATVSKLVDFLVNDDPRNLFLQKVAAKTVQDAIQILPEELPLGLRHGDYGTSNILAGLGGKVTVIDTPAICRSPIYEDLAYILVAALKAKWSQVLSQNLVYDSRQFALYEREFLSGYFGQSPIPYRILRLYQVQTLLVRWSSKVFLLKEQSAGKNKFWKEFQLWQMKRFFKTMLRDLSSQ
jgi:aminoglycoside phosphotransferase (APT) family kinase protein